jgi:ubiquinone/menaquinone biosynthesis C-methylase UbiE
MSAVIPDTTVAQAYEQHLVPTLNTFLARETVHAARLAAGDRVLDVACGTGIVARLAAEHVSPGGHIAGVDLDAGMVALARSLEPTIPGVSIEWHCASAQEMPFPDGSFDRAFCLQGLQYFPDAGAALAEIRRLLRKGGGFAAAVWTSLEDCKGQLALARALERRGIDTSSIHKAYSFGNPARVGKLFSDAGFSNVETSTGTMSARFPSARGFVDAFGSGSISSRTALSKVPDADRAAFFDEIAAELKHYESASGLQFPLGYLILEATK